MAGLSRGGRRGRNEMTTRPTPTLRQDTTKDKPTFRLQLKSIDPRKKPPREDILRVTCQTLNAPLTKLIDNKYNNNWTAIADREATIDKLLTTKGQTELRKVGIEPQLPPEIKSKRTIFVRQIDSTVGTRSTDDIKNELLKQNDWLKLQEVTKIKDYIHVMKLTCDDVETADWILERGLLAFHTRISPHQCEREEFTHLQICFRCYQYENHTTSDCPTPDKILCSECATDGHAWKSCDNKELKRCINCTKNNLPNQHRTLAAQCPVRKKAIQDKKQKEQDQLQQNQNKTFANIAKQAVVETKTPTAAPTIIQLHSQTQIKLTALILEAHMTSIHSKRPYNELLSENLKLNYGIDAKFSDRDSQELFGMYYDPTATTLPPTVEVAHEDEQSDMDADGEFIDDDDLRGSSLNLQEQTTDDEDLPEITKDAPKTTATATQQPQATASAIPTNQQKPKTQRPPKQQNKEQKRKASSPLSKVTKLPGQWCADDFMLEFEPDNIGLRLFKSSLDKTPIPDAPDGNYLRQELLKDDFGLRFTVDKGNPDTISRLMIDGTIQVNKDRIQTIHHDQFKRLFRGRPSDAYSKKPKASS